MNQIEVDKSSWNVFDNWYPPQEKDALSWGVFEGLLPLYRKIIEKKHNELSTLLTEWNNRLNDLGAPCI